MSNTQFQYKWQQHYFVNAVFSNGSKLGDVSLDLSAEDKYDKWLPTWLS